MFIMGGNADDGIVESVELFDLKTGTITLLEGITTPKKRWGGTCFSFSGQDGREQILMTGGMDQLFLPHANTDIFDPLSFEWGQGPSLPHAQAGAEGAILDGAPVLFGGFYGVAFRKDILTFDGERWVAMSHKLESSRISGLAVSIPEDIYKFCEEEMSV